MKHLLHQPVKVAVRVMQYSSRPGENILDLFGAFRREFRSAPNFMRR